MTILGAIPDKFYTLPSRKKNKENTIDYPSSSLDRRTLKRRGSSELQPPKKPPRTFASTNSLNNPPKSSIFDIFHKSAKPKKSNLRRSVSDASSLRSKAFGPIENNPVPSRKPESDVEEQVRRINTKKQLSPIIEVTQREDYFAPSDLTPSGNQLPKVSPIMNQKNTIRWYALYIITPFYCILI